MSQNPTDTNQASIRFYKHYKNKPYKYIGVVRHSETLEEMALYESLYENKLGTMWVRPKDMFFENIDLNGVTRARFEKINFKISETTEPKELPIDDIALIYEQVFGKKLNLTKVKSIFETHTQFHFILVYDENKLVGFKLGYVRDSVQFYSWLGGVLPDYRNLGLASEMMRIQHKWCIKQGFNSIRTNTGNQFRNMITLNLKHGFEIVGTINSKNQPIKLILEKFIGDKND